MEFKDIQMIGVIGGGIMGHGIAQVMSQNGFNVLLADISLDVLNIALEQIENSLQKLAEKGNIREDEIQKVLSRITTTTDLEETGRMADFIIEAIIENSELKKELFRSLDNIVNDNCILATNTSTLSITELASVTNRPDRFIGMHFMNPVPLMPLVEIITGLLTLEETVETTRQLVLKLTKEPIVVKDSPGFATSRLGISLFLEASRILEAGIASVADIDTAMRRGYGHRMGPFETCDLVGLDARLNNINALYESTHDPAWKPPQLLKDLVNAGFRGRKPDSRGGYYSYFGLG
jgi:3-hydroxybutyryl-CoA dehydrogenase